MLTEKLVRALRGGRITSCKSGKDRTGMSVTADQVHLLSRWHQLPAREAAPLLDEMRRGFSRE